MFKMYLHRRFFQQLPLLFAGSPRFAYDGNVGYLSIVARLGLHAVLSIKDVQLSLRPLSDPCDTRPQGQTPKPLLDGAGESEHGF